MTAIAGAFVAPQWNDDSRVAELSNTLTALTLAGVLVIDTSMAEVVASLRRIVVVSNAPAEAEVDFYDDPEESNSTTCFRSFDRSK